MMKLDLAEIANSIWEIFADNLPRKRADRIVLADRLLDYIVGDTNDYYGYAEIAAYAEAECLHEAATNNMDRIKQERKNVADGHTSEAQSSS